MHDQNGKNPENMQNHPSKIFEKPFKEIPFNSLFVEINYLIYNSKMKSLYN